MPTEYFERRERALLGDRFDALYAAPQETAARGVTVSALRAAPEQFAAQADFPVEPSPFCKAGFVVQDPAFKPGRHPYHHAGVFYSQEPSASSAAPLLGVQPGMRVLDLCAAPGGKSLTIAEQMQNSGELFSGEAMTGRVKLLKQAFDRCGIERAKPYHGDATILNPAFGLGSFDRVLCDVPCSGLGVIGKKPDIREKTLDGIENLLLTQQKILQNGAKYLAPNGRLVYSTCTVNHHENEAQVRQFLQDNQDFSVIAPQIILSGMRVGEYGTLFLPHETSTDGFFAAILERQKNC